MRDTTGRYITAYALVFSLFRKRLSKYVVSEFNLLWRTVNMFGYFELMRGF